MPDVIEKVAEVKRVDEAEEKRVELHVHTKLSEMDGVCNIEEYIDQANAWGMDAIAITDHLVVQAFPKAQHKVEAINKGRETPFKMIYGLEMNMVDPALQIVRNIQDIELEKGTYCVFDLETTAAMRIPALTASVILSRCRCPEDSTRKFPFIWRNEWFQSGYDPFE